MPGGGASSGRLHRCAFSRSCHPAAYGSPTSGGYEAAPPTPRMGDLMGTRIGHAGFLALAVLLGASERGFAAACNGRGVPEALAAAQAQCCPARNHGAYVSCAAHLTNELVKQGKLQPSCKSLIFKAGCPAATTTTPPTTTTTPAPPTTTTSSAPVSTTTSTSAPGASTTTTPASSTTSTTMAGGPTTTSSTTPAPTTTTTPGATSTTTSRAPVSTTTSTSAPGASTTTAPTSETASPAPLAGPTPPAKTNPAPTTTTPRLPP